MDHQHRAESLRLAAREIIESSRVVWCLEDLGPTWVVGSADLNLMTWPDIDIWTEVTPERKQDFIDTIPEIAENLADIDCHVFRLSFNDEYIRPGSPYKYGLYVGIQFLTSAERFGKWKLDIWGYRPSELEAQLNEYMGLKRALESADRQTILTVKAAVRTVPEYRNAITSSDIYRFAIEHGPGTVEDFWAFVGKRP